MIKSSALRTISHKEFLRKAWREISKRNMQSKGLDNVTLKTFKSRLDENLEQISVELRTGQYRFNKLRAHAMRKTGSDKLRPLQIASVRDRVVMKAVALHIEPSFGGFNLPCSFAFIKGRGVQQAIKRIHELVQQGNKFYFEADIINFFGAVDRQALWRMFSKRVHQRSLLPLLQQCFNLELENLDKHETFFQKLFFGTDSGIPQGGVLSPMLANFYLYEFDRRMIKEGFNLVRYADDFVVMCDTEERARQAHDYAKAALTSLGLSIHPLDAPNSKSRIGNFSKDHLIFLGVRFEGGEVIPAHKVIERFKTKVSEVLKPGSGVSLFKTLQGLTNLINGWGQFYRAMRVREIYPELDQFIKDAVKLYLSDLGIRLTGRNRRKQMKLLGIPSLTAMMQYKKSASP